MINKKEGRLRKIFPIIIFVLLLAIVITAAENIDGETSGVQETQPIEIRENTSVVEDNFDLCENINCDASNLICTGNFNSTCENFCDPETGVCTSCNLSCEGYEQIIEDEIENGTETIENKTEERNETIEDETEEINETSETPITGDVIDKIPTELNIEIFHVNKIIRGEIFEIRTVITNPRSKVKNVGVRLVLPESFEIVYFNEESCGDLNIGESCEIIVNVKASFSTSLGKEEIKVIASYEV
jgi:hypothetical protein